MGYPIMTRKLYDEFVKLIKRAEYLSLASYSVPGEKVQIWMKCDRDRNNVKFEFMSRPKNRPFEEDDGTYWPFVELYRVKPHNLKKLYSKDKCWKHIEWDNESFGDTAAYLDLVEYHIHDNHSKLNIPGIIKEVYDRCCVNGLADDPEMFWTDNEDGDLNPEDELVDWKRKSANDYNHEEDDEDEW